VQLQREGELVPALPRVVCQQRRADGEVGERGGIRGRRLRALAGDQVELSQLLTLMSGGNQRRAAIELTDDLEDRLLPLLRRRVRREQPSDAEMRLGAKRFRNQGIGGLPTPVVDEAVRAVRPLEQL